MKQLEGAELKQYLGSSYAGGQQWNTHPPSAARRQKTWLSRERVNQRLTVGVDQRVGGLIMKDHEMVQKALEDPELRVCSKLSLPFCPPW